MSESKTMTRKTKRNPQDATLRNIRALKKRVEKLERRVSIVETEWGFLAYEVYRKPKRRKK